MYSRCKSPRFKTLPTSVNTFCCRAHAYEALRSKNPAEKEAARVFFDEVKARKRSWKDCRGIRGWDRYRYEPRLSMDGPVDGYSPMTY